VKSRSNDGDGRNKVTLIERGNPRWPDLENWERELRFPGQSLGKIPFVGVA